MDTGQNGNRAPQLQAARAVLLFLRAAISAGPEVEGIRIGGSDTTSVEQAAMQLFNISKPVGCTANISDHVMVIAHQPCEEVGDTNQVVSSTWFQTALSMTVGDDTPDILLLGSQDALPISRAALQVLGRDYRIDVPYSVSGDAPSPEQSRQGLRWVVAIGPPAVVTTNVDDLDLPEDLRAAVALEYRNALAEHHERVERRER